MLRLSKIFQFASILIILHIIFAGMTLAVSLSPSITKSLELYKSGNIDSTVKVVMFVEDNKISLWSQKASAFKTADFKTKHKLVIEDLKNRNAGSINSIYNLVRAINPNTDIKKFWIAPALAFEIPISKIDELINLPGVVSIIEDGSLEYTVPVETPFTASKTSAVPSHLAAMNIPALWNMGIDGSGRLICNFDTGVDGDHPALQGKWRGNTASSTSTWFAPRQDEDTPHDPVGHGTQTMGIMLGGTETDTIGVAPGAEWISAAVVDQGQTLSNTISDILNAFEWAIDPDGNPATVDDMPDVILNSWGIPTSIMEPCDETFYQVIDNIEAAGIVTIFAAGNEGPAPYSLRMPANRASSPLNSFAVGAIDHNTNLIASFSSRGPSSCDSTSIKPEVVAPGVGIYTTAKGGGYRYSTGTSMAAPIIAGLVTLLRQYNPELTVDQIKNAIIESATDLGPSGEDNAYGHGLPNAAKALALVPMPENPEVGIAGTIIAADGIADPGETFGLFLKLSTIANVLDSLTGYLLCDDSRVTLLDNQAAFIFAPGNTQSINIAPYMLSFNNQLIHGDIIHCRFAIDLPFGIPYDTLDLDLTVGTPPNGHLLTHESAHAELTVSDFGQFGMGENSVYPAGGRGLRYLGSDNLLYEAGIIVGRNSLQLTSSVRDSLGRADVSDFSPVSAISTNYSTSTGGFTSYAEFTDSNAGIPIPITVNQKIINYVAAGDDQYFIIRYFLKNSTGESVTNLSFGYFTDFDLSASGDQAGSISESNLFYQLSGQYAVGVVALSDMSGLMTLENGAEKLPLTHKDKLDYIRQTGINVNDQTIGDFMSIMSFGPYNIMPNDSIEISLAVVVGSSLTDVEYFANRARERYFGYTDIVVQTLPLPEDFELHQNYPNPFNPLTTISFHINNATRARLSVINILGQEVSVLHDEHTRAGEYSVKWDGTDKNGSRVASGIYFYKLETDSMVQTKKMLMIK